MAGIKALPAQTSAAPAPGEASGPRRLARNAAALSAAQVIRIGFNALLSVLIARQLGVEGLGKFAVIAAYWNIFQIVAATGAPRLVVRNIAREPQSARRWFQRAVVNQVGSAILAGLLLLLVSGLLRHAADTQAALALVALALLPAAAVSAVESVFQGLEQMHVIAYAQAAATALQGALCVVLLWTGHGIVAVAWALLASQLALAAIESIGARGLHLWQEWRFDSLRSEMKAALDLAVHSFDFYLTSLSQILYSRLDVLILSQIAGDAATGLYSAAFVFVVVLKFLWGSVSLALYPVLSSLFATTRDRFAALLRRSLRLSVALSMPVAIGLVALADPLITAIFGPGYTESARLLRLLAPCIALFAWNAILSIALMAGNQQRSTVVVAALKLATALLYYAALTFWLGIWGAALATVLAEATAALLNGGFLRLKLEVAGLPQAVAKPLIAGIVALAALFGMASLPWIVAALVATALYAVLIIALRAVEPEDRHMLRQLVRAGGSA